MPGTLIKALDGIEIRIFPDDHNPPHFRVFGPGITFSVAMQTLEVLAGKYHRNAKQVMVWAKTNKTLLHAEWERRNG